MRFRGVVAVLALAAVLAIAAVAAAETPARYRSVARCGRTSSPIGPLGLYVAEGRVTCAKAAFLIHRPSTNAEVTLIGLGDYGRYPDGWLCGGQMGYYFCFWPWNAPHLRYRERVYAQSCTTAGVGCPARVREWVSGSP
jgi:hypothetical protein